MPGPVPKHSSQRRRRNKPTGPELIQATTGRAVKRPRVSSHWHPLVKDWFRSLGESGQAVFYQPSDWQTARIAAEMLSRELSNDELRANAVTEFNRMAAALMTTEGERRRLRIELTNATAPASQSAEVIVLSDYNELLGNG